MDQLAALKEYFGHTSFRPGQQALVDALLAGRDALGVMPTGGGKSLCYQLPALELPGVTIVISPLISLMADQVAALRQAGVPAGYVNSALTPAQQQLVFERARAGAYKLLYVAPERLETAGFGVLAQQLDIPLVVVDEAHCISQWGQDFRPSYLKIADFLAALPRRPAIGAFTATATAAVQADILRALGLRDPVQIVTGFDRPNLYFDVQKQKRKLEALLSLVQARREKSGIIYCATRVQTERVCAALCAAGIAATRYHAGLSERERRQDQEDFQFDRKLVMVATNAFGMGIDKSNVSYVIHFNMPKSVEAYYQEAGRAGRDGAAAECILLFAPGDVQTARFLIEHSGSDALDEDTQARVREQDLTRLRQMTQYCKTDACLRGYILDYFGQPHAERCQNCGTCCAEFTRQDITVPAQMILSCILRVREKLGYFVGKTLISNVLHGSKSQRVLAMELNTLSTYGLMRQIKRADIRAYIDALERQQVLWTDPEHDTLCPGARANAVLFGGGSVEMAIRAAEHAPEAIAPRAAEAAAPEKLLAALKQTRARLGREQHVPLYMIFSNATLEDMARRAPRTLDEFLQVSGVGAKKAERYSDVFLQTIAQYLEQQ